MLTKLSVDQALIKAKSYTKKGELVEAYKIYQSILKIFSKNKRAKDGLNSLSKVIQNNTKLSVVPKEVINQLTNLYNLGQFSLVYKKARLHIKKYPEEFILWNIIGVSAVQIGKLEQGIIAFKKVISINPDYADAYNNMSVALKNQGKLTEAIDACKKALKVKPNYADAYNNLGNALKDQGKLQEAIDAFKKAIFFDANHAYAYNNMGNILLDRGMVELAIDTFRKALTINPNFALACNNLGNAYKDQGKLDKAIESYKQSISLDPNYADAHLNLSLCLLQTGQIKEGLEEYEWRWKTKKGLLRQRHFRKPQWDSQTMLKDKTILIWSEQGIGDTINWSVYLPFISSQVKHVILECPKKLVPLLSRSFPNIEVKAQDRSKDIQRDDFDFHLPMGSIYKNFIDEIMNNNFDNAYLIPDPERVKFWQNRLHSLGKGLFVGISWKSSNMSPDRLQNYLSISDLYPILKMPNLTFINLQYTDYENDISKVEDELGITIHNFSDIDHFDDLLDVASLCSALDMTITNKNSLSFISASVGTSTKLANWKQSAWNNILLNPVGPLVKKFERNSWESWKNTINSIRNDIKISNIQG